MYSGQRVKELVDEATAKFAQWVTDTNVLESANNTLNDINSAVFAFKLMCVVIVFAIIFHLVAFIANPISVTERGHACVFTTSSGQIAVMTKDQLGGKCE